MAQDERKPTGPDLSEGIPTSRSPGPKKIAHLTVMS